MMDSGIVTILMVTYKNFTHINEAIDSVVRQDYPAIEFIIQDDGSSNYDGNKDKIEEYVRKNNSGNIKEFKLLHSAVNQGTSKNINCGLESATGSYLKLLTPDDMLYSDTTISECVEFCKNNNAEVLVGQTYVMRRGDRETFDEIENSIKYRWESRHGRLCTLSPSDNDIDYLCHLSDEKGKELIASRPIISTLSVFYNMKVIRRTKGFPEQYRLMEDMPYWPELAGMGIKFYFSHIRMTRYELSGISNGGAHSEEFMRDYFDVMKNTYIKNEVRGGLLNPLVKKYRRRKAYYFANGSNNSKGFFDVKLGKFIGNVKYLVTGSKL